MAVYVDETGCIGQGSPLDVLPFTGERQMNTHIQVWIFFQHFNGLWKMIADDHDLDGGQYPFPVGLDASEIRPVTVFHIVTANDQADPSNTVNEEYTDEDDQGSSSIQYIRFLFPVSSHPLEHFACMKISI